MLLLAQQVVNGLFLGAVFTLVALAFSLNMGILGVLNIAIAELFMFGGFIGLALLERGLPLPLVLGTAMVVAGLLSLLLERVGYQPVDKDDPTVTLLTTIGFGLILQNVAINVWGSEPSFFPSRLFSERASLGPLRVSAVQGVSVLVTVLLVVVLWYLVSRTRLGRGLRAVAENREAAVLLGVRVLRVEVATFVAAGLLAGGAGVLLGLNYGVISPEFGIEIGISGIAAMILGGVRNIWGALVAGPVLGLASVLSAAYLGAGFQDMVVFGLLILTLLVRPQGLLGRRDPTAGRV
ncbi:MAG: branched-chain amino acid ABC transporter permease [Actinomycetota bacterium]|nr:branched-chain amino acid ABC transporter permease [Actinomycetota bacterium]